MLPRAIQAGLCPEDFWRLTLKELEEILLYQVKYEKERAYALAVLLYNTASMIVLGFHDPKHLPKFEKAFPGFDSQPRSRQQDWRVMKARIAAYREQKEAAEKGGILW